MAHHRTAASEAAVAPVTVVTGAIVRSDLTVTAMTVTAMTEEVTEKAIAPSDLELTMTPTQLITTPKVNQSLSLSKSMMGTWLS